MLSSILRMNLLSYRWCGIFIFLESILLTLIFDQAAGIAQPSFVSSLLEEQQTEEEMQIIKDTALGIYAGGSDTV